MNGRDFEREVLKLLQAQGFIAEMTEATADGGIDIVAKRTDPLLAGKYIVQCKSWTKPVGEPLVRDLYGVVMAENANKGILITTSRFTDSARAFAERKALELIDGQMWNDLLAQRPDVELTKRKLGPVPLKDILESPEIRNLRSPLTVVLGVGEDGKPVIGNLAEWPSLLIAGKPLSGKTTLLKCLLTCLVDFNSPASLRLLLIDPKMVELVHFNGLPHLTKPVVRGVQEASFALRGVMKEMDRRYQEFAKAGVRNVEEHNALRQTGGEQSIPYIVVAINELTDLMTSAPDEIDRLLERLAGLSYKAGIYLIIATRRATRDVVSEGLGPALPARVSFGLTSKAESRLVLGTAGAERLTRPGEMLYKAPGSSRPVLVHGCTVSDREIARLIAYWQLEAGLPDEQEAIPWVGLGVRLREGYDDLFEEAMALVMRHERASASFLQRRLGIGYPRAARLIEQLEEAGIVGPMEAAGGSRKVLMHGEEAIGGRKEPETRGVDKEEKRKSWWQRLFGD